MGIEDTRRRNEASMARKRMNAKAINPAAAGSSDNPSLTSPSSTGAMDSLLEKLRAAAPQARDQRDRRRRARLKDRHQIRVASGQTIPDMGDLTKDSEGEDMGKTILSPESTISGEGTESKLNDMATISEGEDIADRAASMLQGLRGDGDTESTIGSQSGSIRVRRRRESADDERRSRRRRRGAATSSSIEDREGTLSPGLETTQEVLSEEANDGNKVSTPTTVVSPPSPDGSRFKPVELSD